MGRVRARPLLTTRTSFEQIPVATAPTAVADHYFIRNTGVGTPAYTRATKGGLKLTTSALASDATLLVGVALTPFQTALSATNTLRFESIVSIPTLTSVFVRVGATNSASATDPAGVGGTDAVDFIFDSSGTLGGAAANWIAATRVGSTTAYINTGIAVVADQDYELAVEFGTDMIPKYYIDGALVATAVLPLTAVTLVAQVGVKTTTALARDLNIRQALVSRLAA